MTYNVFGRTLNPTLSLSISVERMLLACSTGMEAGATLDVLKAESGHEVRRRM